LFGIRWKYKHPGRVGDSPLIGSGLYCDGAVGAAVATGYGEEIMRVCLSYLVVESMRTGMTVQSACVYAIQRLLALPPNKSLLPRMNAGAQITVGIVAMDNQGNIGAASTISSTNLHHDEDYFPVMAWHSSSNNNRHSDLIMLQARPEGVGY